MQWAGTEATMAPELWGLKRQAMGVESNMQQAIPYSAKSDIW